MHRVVDDLLKRQLRQRVQVRERQCEHSRKSPGKFHIQISPRPKTRSSSTSRSTSFFLKKLIASCGDSTSGSPLSFRLVLRMTGTPVIRSNSSISSYTLGLSSRVIVCKRADPS